MEKRLTIDWLETNRNNGFFDGFAEENMDFNKLDNKELDWYYKNWIKKDQEDDNLNIKNKFKIFSYYDLYRNRTNKELSKYTDYSDKKAHNLTLLEFRDNEVEYQNKSLFIEENNMLNELIDIEKEDFDDNKEKLDKIRNLLSGYFKKYGKNIKRKVFYDEYADTKLVIFYTSDDFNEKELRIIKDLNYNYANSFIVTKNDIIIGEFIILDSEIEKPSQDVKIIDKYMYFNHGAIDYEIVDIEPQINMSKIKIGKKLTEEMFD